MAAASPALDADHAAAQPRNAVILVGVAMPDHGGKDISAEYDDTGKSNAAS